MDDTHTLRHIYGRQPFSIFDVVRLHHISFRCKLFLYIRNSFKNQTEKAKKSSNNRMTQKCLLQVGRFFLSMKIKISPENLVFGLAHRGPKFY